jgi:hyaluronoglucosaminidase
MATRRVWLTLSLAAAWIAIAAVVLVPRAITAAHFLFLGPAVTFQAGRGPDGIVLSPDGRTLYAADEGYWTGSKGVNGHTVTPVSLTTTRAGRPINAGPNPASLAITPDGRHLFVLSDNLDHPLIRPVDLATGRELAAIRIPGDAWAMAISPDGKTLYTTSGAAVLGGGPDEIIPVSLITGRAGTPIPLPDDPVGIAAIPIGT